MSVQHLFKFQAENDYKTAKRNHLILPNISKIVESGDTYINSEFSTKETCEAGDIIAYHIEDNGDKTVKYVKPEAFDAKDGYWVADAVVAVPFSHTEDGSVRAISLAFTEDTFSNAYSIGEASEIRRYGNLTTFASKDCQTAECSHGLSDHAVCPSDSFSTIANPFDVETFYAAESAVIVPSPYDNDGSMNDAYHSKGDFSSFTSNPLMDMDGRGNTEALVKDNFNSEAFDSLCASAIKSSSVLKPCVFDEEKTIEENMVTMPWYLPSAGEMGYYMARKARIDYALGKAGKAVSANVLKFATSTVSTDNGKTLSISTDGNIAYSENGTDDLCVIPFCKY